MIQKGNAQYALSTIAIAALLLKLAGSETTILEGALALFTTPLGEMIRDGSVIGNTASLLILLVITNAALRLLGDVRLQGVMTHAIKKHLEDEADDQRLGSGEEN